MCKFQRNVRITFFIIHIRFGCSTVQQVASGTTIALVGYRHRIVKVLHIGIIRIVSDKLHRLAIVLYSKRSFRSECYRLTVLGTYIRYIHIVRYRLGRIGIQGECSNLVPIRPRRTVLCDTGGKACQVYTERNRTGSRRRIITRLLLVVRAGEEQ